MPIIGTPAYRFERALVSPRFRLDRIETDLKAHAVDRFDGTVQIIDTDRLAEGAFDMLIEFENAQKQRHLLRLDMPAAAPLTLPRGSHVWLKFAQPGPAAPDSSAGGFWLGREKDGQSFYYLGVRLGESGDLPFPEGVPGGIKLTPQRQVFYIEASTYESLCDAQLWHAGLEVRANTGTCSLSAGQHCDLATEDGTVRILLVDHVGLIEGSCEGLNPAHLTVIAVRLP